MFLFFLITDRAENVGVKTKYEEMLLCTVPAPKGTRSDFIYTV